MEGLIVAIISIIVSVASAIIGVVQSEKSRAQQKDISEEAISAQEKAQSAIRRETERKVLSDESANRGTAIARFAELE